jgi:putative membrane protein
MKLSDKAFFRLAMVVSIVVFVLVVMLNKRVLNPPTEFPEFIYRLPLLHAIINGTCAVLLIFSFRAIKAKKISTHKRLNSTAFILSAIFLLSYVVYHFFVPETTFGGQGAIKYVYYFILISHIILAAIVLPLILLSFWYALNNKIEQHRKIVRFSFPVWLYVAVTGVVVYLMISPYYAF